MAEMRRSNREVSTRNSGARESSQNRKNQGYVTLMTDGWMDSSLNSDSEDAEIFQTIQTRRNEIPCQPGLRCMGFIPPAFCTRMRCRFASPNMSSGPDISETCRLCWP